MKITYIPCHTSIDIFFPLASSTRLSAEWRIGVIQTLINLGHTVEVCGSIETTQRKVLQAIKSGDYKTASVMLPEVDKYSFYEGVEFNEDGYPNKPDILLVEGGTTNSFHTRKLGSGKVTVQQYAYEAVCRHKGRVFWFCPEPKYAFRFQDLNQPTGNAKPETDLRALLHSSSRFVKDKKFVWLMTDHNKEEFRARSGIPRDFPLEQVAFTPYGVAEPEICAPGLAVRPLEKLEWDIVYIGHTANPEEKKRKDQLVQILSGAEEAGVRAAIFGNHDDDFNIPGVKKFPKTANMGVARDILNRSLMTPLVLRHDFIETQHESNRQTQATQCGCITVKHPSVQYSPELATVGSISDVKQLADYFSAPAVRNERLNTLRKIVPKYKDYLPAILALEGAPIADIWGKELPAPSVEEIPALL